MLLGIQSGGIITSTSFLIFNQKIYDLDNIHHSADFMGARISDFLYIGWLHPHFAYHSDCCFDSKTPSGASRYLTKTKMNKIIYFDIQADDFNHAKKFYKEVFGWDIKRGIAKEKGSMGYWAETRNKSDKRINGGLYQRPILIKR